MARKRFILILAITLLSSSVGWAREGGSCGAIFGLRKSAVASFGAAGGAGAFGWVAMSKALNANAAADSARLQEKMWLENLAKGHATKEDALKWSKHWAGKALEQDALSVSLGKRAAAGYLGAVIGAFAGVAIEWMFPLPVEADDDMKKITGNFYEEHPERLLALPEAQACQITSKSRKVREAVHALTAKLDSLKPELAANSKRKTANPSRSADTQAPAPAKASASAR